MIKKLLPIRFQPGLFNLSCVFIFSLFSAGIYSQPYTVAIFPFTYNTAEDSLKLQNAIYDLLSSRLTKNSSVTLINRDTTEKVINKFPGFERDNLALMAGAELQADYVIYGALTAQDTIIDVVIRITDISGKTQPYSLQQHARVPDDVIPIINHSATEINERIFTNATAPETIESSLKASPLQKQPAQRKNSGTVSERKAQTIQQLPNTATARLQNLWKSHDIKTCISGIAVDDIDRDGKNEIILLTPKTIQTFRFENGSIKKIKTIHTIRLKFPIAIDVADINGNGYPELFITALDTYKSAVLSFVLEYDGQSYKVIEKNINSYLRVVKEKDSPPMLLAQKHYKYYPFRGEIHTMKWEKSKYVPEKQIIPSAGINVLGAAYGDLWNNGQKVIVAYDEYNHIKVINPSGEQIWESDATYGGSSFYYQIIGKETEKERKYFPMRLLIHDMDNDGKQKVVAAKNYELTRNILAKFKYYNKNHLEILSLDQVSLNTETKTGIILGFIRDFITGDIDNDGREELVAALVNREGNSIFVKPLSFIIAYEH